MSAQATVAPRSPHYLRRRVAGRSTPADLQVQSLLPPSGRPYSATSITHPSPTVCAAEHPTTLQAGPRRRAGRWRGSAWWGPLRRRGQETGGWERGQRSGGAQVGQGQRPVRREVRWGRGRRGGGAGGGWRGCRRQWREVGRRRVGAGRWGQGPLRRGRSIVNGEGAAVVVRRVVEGRRLDASEVHAPALEFKQRHSAGKLRPRPNQESI